MDRHGHKARAGGWGWLLGDEGSAFAIARNALLAAFYAFDGVGPATRLEDMFVKHFGVASMYEVKRLLHAPDFEQRGFATLAPLVSRAAEEGDAISAAIIREAGQALAKQVMAVIRRLDFAAAPVAPIGGAFEHVTGLRPAFGAALSAASDSATVTDPKLSPAHGAVIIALKQATPNWERSVAALQSKS
jgi:N-acetylglucosamine kinase-like BadF-type ATPase